MLKKLLLALLVLLLIAAGVVLYFWTQATALPDWYEPEGEAAVAEASPEESADTRGLQWQPAKDEGEGAMEVRGFHRKAPLLKGESRKAIRASRAVRTKDKLEAGVVVDTSKISKQEMSKRDNATLERALEAFPGLTQRDVYIGVEDTPVTKDGVLQLSPKARLRVGNLTYSLADAAKRMGIPESKLRDDLNKQLQKMDAKDPQAG
ncbi:MAG: hypothetical protein H6713_18810 [Myxococcales bacterium]|nr:hypothetical protein [Myxococcales bacterium]